MVQMKRHTSSKRGRNRSHLALKKISLNKCPKCGQAVQPHRACNFCGTYKGRDVIKIKSKKEKK
jgi:large subunit ribosomal protein L32